MPTYKIHTYNPGAVDPGTGRRGEGARREAVTSATASRLADVQTVAQSACEALEGEEAYVDIVEIVPPDGQVWRGRYALRSGVAVDVTEAVATADAEIAPARLGDR